MKSLLKRLILPLKNMDKALPKSGTILDLGCGEGLVSHHLSTQKKRQIIGIDLDPQKIKIANNKRKSNLKFITGSILNYAPLKKISGCVLADVLHHLSKKSQLALLKKISKIIKPGGVLVIKEINTDDVLRSTLSRIWDFIFYPNDKINYFSKSQLIQILAKQGFTIRHEQTNLLSPASVHLFIATKK